MQINNNSYYIMSVNTQNVVLFVTYVISCEIILTNSRTSTLWKLNSDQTKIIEASPFHQVVSIQSGIKSPQYITADDPVFNIITSTVRDGQTWMKEHVEYFCTTCNNLSPKTFSDKIDYADNSSSSLAISKSTATTTATEAEEVLDCGKPVNFTYYDNLVGVLNRNRHPNVPEPHALLSFSKMKKLNKDFDIDALERRLKKAKREKPKSIQLYNQIGNFWRIKGDAQKSIECFRRALAVSPHNAEVLLNLARVLYTLQYLDDAIFLTRRSLEVQSPDKGAWQHYFTLGEIFRAYGRYQEAMIHFRHTLELKPSFEPAITALKELEAIHFDTIHVYTLVIIICLVLGVLLVILSSVDSITEGECQEVKNHRHFNKAMAMKTLRGLSMKNIRSRSKTNP